LILLDLCGCYIIPKILKHPFREGFEGLSDQGVALFKVPTDFQEGKFTAKSGYFMFFLFGPIELYKL
jgi:hypothetical protein